MAKHLRKAEAKLNKRLTDFRAAVEGREKGTNGGGGYVERKTAGSYRKPGSMKR
jgi:hypothetical protein